MLLDNQGCRVKINAECRFGLICELQAIENLKVDLNGLSDFVGADVFVSRVAAR